MNTPTSIRPVFRYRLQTMLVGVTILSGLSGWIAHSYRVVKERRAYLPKFHELGSCLRQVTLFDRGDVAEVPWMRRLLGDYAVETLMYAPEADKDGQHLRRARELFPEANIWGWPRLTPNLPPGVKPLDPNRGFI